MNKDQFISISLKLQVDTIIKWNQMQLALKSSEISVKKQRHLWSSGRTT